MNTDDSIYAKEIETVRYSVKELMEFIRAIRMANDVNNIDDTLPIATSTLLYEVTTVELVVYYSIERWDFYVPARPLIKMVGDSLDVIGMIREIERLTFIVSKQDVSNVEVGAFTFGDCVITLRVSRND